MGLLSITFNVIIIIAILHFIYQSIILPTIKEQISYRLFTLRDEVRLLAYKQKGELNEEIFDYLESTINNSINFIPFISFKFLADAQELVNKNRQLQIIIEKNKELLRKYSTDEIRTFENRKLQLLKNTLVFNTLGLFIYVVPVVILTAFLFGTYSKLKKSIGTFGSIPEEQCEGELTKDRNFVFA